MKIKPEILKTLAIFMSFLVITIPFYVSNVYAVSGNVNIESIKGSDGIENVAKAGDTVQVEAQVTPGEHVEASALADALHLSYPGSYEFWSFTSCTGQPGGGPPYTCSYSLTASPFPGKRNLDVCLGGGGNCCSNDCSSCSDQNCRASSYILVDGFGPLLESFDISPRNTTGTGLSASYSVKDRLGATASDYCSGISRIEITKLDGTSLHSDDINSEDCSKSGTIDDFSLSSLSNGVHTICLKAYDLLDQESAGSKCVEIRKDDTQPVIDAAGVYDESGTAPISYISPAGTRAKFVVEATASEYFGIKSAVADLSMFGLSQDSLLDCTSRTTTEYKCVKDLPVMRSEVEGSVKVTVTDDGGNKVSTTKQISLGEDSAAPEVEAVLTDYSYNNTGYVAPGFNNITAVINDTGAGLAGSNIIISVSGAQNDYNNSANCTSMGGEEWRCTVFNVSLAGDAGVSITGSDDSGNRLSPYSETLIYDDSKPSLLNVSIRNIAREGAPFFVGGDDMLMRAMIEDNTALKNDDGDFNVFAKFRTSSGMWLPATDCWHSGARSGAGNRLWNCTWELMNVQEGDFKVWLNISDIMGNTKAPTRKVDEFFIETYNVGSGEWFMLPLTGVRIYPGGGNQTPDYWDAAVVGSQPSFVDSSTTMIVGHDIWFKIELAPKVPGVELARASFDPRTCGWHFDDYADISNTYMLNFMPNSTERWIKVGLYTGAIDVDPLNFNCSLTLTTLYNGMLSNPERENITMSIGTLAYDEVHSIICEKIEDVEEGWLVEMSEWWTVLNNLVELSQLLCQTVKTMFEIYTLLTGLNAATSWLAGTLLAPIAWFFSILAASGEATDTSTFTAFNTFCDFIACKTVLCDGGDGDSGGDGNAAVDAWCGVGVGNTFDRLSDGVFSSTEAGLGEFSASHPGLGEAAGLSETSMDSATGPLWGNPRDSIVLSILYVCIPGIIINMNKMMEIECQYLLCLKAYVPAGVPPSMCTTLRDYQWCIFIWGEIFQLIPFANLVRQALQAIIQILMNPMAFLLAMGLVWFCAVTHPYIDATCRVLKIAPKVMSLVATFEQISENEDLLDLQSGVCTQALDMETPECDE